MLCFMKFFYEIRIECHPFLIGVPQERDKLSYSLRNEGQRQKIRTRILRFFLNVIP